MDRRTFVQLCSGASIYTISGCNGQSDDSESTPVQDRLSEATPTPSLSGREVGWFRESPDEWYENMVLYIRGLRTPWESEPSRFADNYRERLEQLALDLIVPGVEDIAGPADDMTDIVRSTGVSFQILNQSWGIQQIEQYRAAWCAKVTEIPRERYRELDGLSEPVDIDVDGCEVIKPLFDTVILSFNGYAVAEDKAEKKREIRDVVQKVLDIFALVDPAIQTSGATDDMNDALNDNLVNYRVALRVLEAVISWDLGGRWLPWVPIPQEFATPYLGVDYWDFSAIRDTIVEKTGKTRGEIDYKSSPVATSPYEFVEPSLEKEFIQVRNRDAEILYEVIVGSFSMDDLEEMFDIGDMSKFIGYTIFEGRDHVVAIGSGSIIIPTTNIGSVDEQLSVIESVIRTKIEDTPRYYDEIPEFNTLSKRVLKSTMGLEYANIVAFGDEPVEDADSEWGKNLVAIGESAEDDEETSTGKLYFYFDHPSNIDIDTIRADLDETFEVEGRDGLNSHYQVRDRLVIAIFNLETENNELWVEGPSGIGFRECEMVRTKAKDKIEGC